MSVVEPNIRPQPETFSSRVCISPRFDGAGQQAVAGVRLALVEQCMTRLEVDCMDTQEKLFTIKINKFK
jgi:hypothetical protein